MNPPTYTARDINCMTAWVIRDAYNEEGLTR